MQHNFHTHRTTDELCALFSCARDGLSAERGSAVKDVADLQKRLLDSLGELQREQVAVPSLRATVEGAPPAPQLIHKPRRDIQGREYSCLSMEGMHWVLQRAAIALGSGN
jgi:hypothetical protein